MRRTLIVTLAVIVTLAGLGYLAHSFDIAGMIVRMHTPPPH